MNKPLRTIKPIGLDDVRALVCGGNGYCETYGKGLAMALDAMTSAALDLKVVNDALQSETHDTEEVSSVVLRVAWQLERLADVCFRVASTEGITFDDTRRADGAAQPDDSEAAE
jgi:hypothetical protein